MIFSPARQPLETYYLSREKIILTPFFRHQNKISLLMNQTSTS